MPTGFESVQPDSWLQLGIAGAALLIVLITIVLIFNQQSKNITQLCNKIDQLVTNFVNTNNTLSEVIISNDKDQKEVIRLVNELHEDIRDINNRVVRVDARLFDYIKAQGKEVDTHASIDPITYK